MPNLWEARIQSAAKSKLEWQTRFDTSKSEKYFEGEQWRTSPGQEKPYVLNMIFSTIRIKLAGLIFKRPRFILSPTPGHSDWNLEAAVKCAQLKQDALNSIISNRKLRFARQLQRAAQDSFFQFGIVETGYSADFRNPLDLNSMKEGGDDADGDDKDKLIKPQPLIESERIYFKRIQPRRFVTCVTDESDLEDLEWYGYWQFYYTDQLARTPGIKKEDLISDGYSGNYTYGLDEIDDNTRLMLKEGETTKVWHIFDNVSKERKLISSSGNVLWSEPFERTPISDIRWVYRNSGFYPIPPVSQWLSPQDEINESRQQMKSYRRRFTNKFGKLKGKIDQEEVDKFITGGEGTVVEVKDPNALFGISNPNQTGPTSEGFIISKDDFRLMSGSSAEAAGVADRQTATASKIQAGRSEIIESAEQIDFSEFACSIGREILLTAQERLSMPIWVKMTGDPQDAGNGQVQIISEFQANAPTYQQVLAADLVDGHDFDIDVNIENSTPSAMQSEQQAFITFNTLLLQFPHLAMDGDLIRETAYRSGYRNEKIIQKMQQTALLAMAAKSGPAVAAANGGNAQDAQMQTPTDPQMTNQLNNQLQ
jgi:hypothetical protein